MTDCLNRWMKPIDLKISTPNGRSDSLSTYCSSSSSNSYYGNESSGSSLNAESWINNIRSRRISLQKMSQMSGETSKRSSLSSIEGEHSSKKRERTSSSATFNDSDISNVEEREQTEESGGCIFCHSGQYERQYYMWKSRYVRSSYCSRCTDDKTGRRYVSYWGTPSYESGSWKKRYKGNRSTEIDLSPLIDVLSKIDAMDTSMGSIDKRTSKANVCYYEKGNSDQVNNNNYPQNTNTFEASSKSNHSDKTITSLTGVNSNTENNTIKRADIYDNVIKRQSRNDNDVRGQNIADLHGDQKMINDAVVTPITPNDCNDITGSESDSEYDKAYLTVSQDDELENKGIQVNAFDKENKDSINMCETTTPSFVVNINTQTKYNSQISDANFYLNSYSSENENECRSGTYLPVHTEVLASNLPSQHNTLTQLHFSNSSNRVTDKRHTDNSDVHHIHDIISQSNGTRILQDGMVNEYERQLCPFSNDSYTICKNVSSSEKNMTSDARQKDKDEIIETGFNLINESMFPRKDSKGMSKNTHLKRYTRSKARQIIQGRTERVADSDRRKSSEHFVDIFNKSKNVSQRYGSTDSSNDDVKSIAAYKETADVSSLDKSNSTIEKCYISKNQCETKSYNIDKKERNMISDEHCCQNVDVDVYVNRSQNKKLLTKGQRDVKRKSSTTVKSEEDEDEQFLSIRQKVKGLSKYSSSNWNEDTSYIKSIGRIDDEYILTKYQSNASQSDNNYTFENGYNPINETTFPHRDSKDLPKNTYFKRYTRSNPRKMIQDRTERVVESNSKMHLEHLEEVENKSRNVNQRYDSTDSSNEDINPLEANIKTCSISSSDKRDINTPIDNFPLKTNTALGKNSLLTNCSDNLETVTFKLEHECKSQEFAVNEDSRNNNLKQYHTDSLTTQMESNKKTTNISSPEINVTNNTKKEACHINKEIFAKSTRSSNTEVVKYEVKCHFKSKESFLNANYCANNLTQHIEDDLIQPNGDISNSEYEDTILELYRENEDDLELNWRTRGYNTDFYLSRKSVTGSEIVGHFKKALHNRHTKSDRARQRNRNDTDDSFHEKVMIKLFGGPATKSELNTKSAPVSRRSSKKNTKSVNISKTRNEKFISSTVPVSRKGSGESYDDTLNVQNNGGKTISEPREFLENSLTKQTVTT